MCVCARACVYVEVGRCEMTQGRMCQMVLILLNTCFLDSCSHLYSSIAAHTHNNNGYIERERKQAREHFLLQCGPSVNLPYFVPTFLSFSSILYVVFSFSSLSLSLSLLICQPQIPFPFSVGISYHIVSYRFGRLFCLSFRLYIFAIHSIRILCCRLTYSHTHTE